MSEYLAFSKNMHSAGTEVSVNSFTPIGRGLFGKVIDASISFPDRDSNYRFAIKQYFDKDCALYSLAMYQKVRELGINTFSTYRISDDQSDILMTLKGNQDGMFLVGSSLRDSRDEKALKKEKFTVIGNFSDTVVTFIESIKSAGNTIELPNDSFFFHYNKHNQELELLIGDFDKVSEIETDSSDIIKSNISNLLGVTHLFVETYGKQEDISIYIETLRKIYQKYEVSYEDK